MFNCEPIWVHVLQFGIGLPLLVVILEFLSKEVINDRERVEIGNCFDKNASICERVDYDVSVADAQASLQVAAEFRRKSKIASQLRSSLEDIDDVSNLSTTDLTILRERLAELETHIGKGWKSDGREPEWREVLDRLKEDLPPRPDLNTLSI